MKKLINITLGLALGLFFVVAANAQETMMKSIGSSVKKGTTKVYDKGKSGVKKGYRVGHTVGDKTWNGSKWVASKSYNGGKWVAVKGKNGTKWVYRKATGKSSHRRP